MRIESTVAITAPDGTVHTDTIAPLDKRTETSGAIGLSIADGKDIVLQLQQDIVTAQCAASCASRACCPASGRKLRCKGHREIRCRTVFGDVAVDSSRYYQAPGHDGAARTFSPLTDLLPDHVAPELLWLETKGASPVSFGVTADLLKDVLPIDQRLNPETIRRHRGRMATRTEDELAAERFSFIDT